MNRKRNYPSAMTIAGSDPSGGAGIQADVLTIESTGVHATSAVTALTVQNTFGVREVVRTEPRIVAGQIESIMEDIGADGVKTGMLVDGEIVRAVADSLRDYDIPLVIDPVIRSSTGHTLLDDTGVNELKKSLLPRAILVTPNVREAELLCGISIGNENEALKAASEIIEMGAHAVLVTGCHFEEDRIMDLLVDENGVREYERKFIPGRDPHGTGCMLSAAISAYLAKGNDLFDAVEFGTSVVNRSIRFPLETKGGSMVAPLNHLMNEAARYPVMKEVRECVRELETKNIYELIPEVASNFVTTLPYATGIEEAAGIEGRIVRLKDRVHAHIPWYGVSDHVARFLLNIQMYDRSVRSSMNIKLTRDIRKICEELDLDIAFAPRMEEPISSAEEEHRTMDWAAAYVMEGRDKAPDIVIDEGGVGKEPMIRVLADSSRGLLEKVLSIWREL
ncbi:MAG: bifunctional hydroxymethylpyrimidine kinase/phosphomethylpyrimidine kinase [Candidatus Thermoplasmatota archaeon]|jgi:hydroxymethylpyrimidine/phosphomethylpyrimidine kinase|nr:bifunctional hydroxymethylpyrimidine kinase/phosphomethylpyrimidine kinase [Candidatus Thermoplasmatota archaeon]MDP7266029.1 bifunctional hydroxymethylpyrimidine kinase/phosphomethylpyrimidine kinase [Candidatus Thermoplasmatota archaeon]